MDNGTRVTEYDCAGCDARLQRTPGPGSPKKWCGECLKRRRCARVKAWRAKTGRVYPKKKDLPCAECGTMMWRSTTTLPEGQATCKKCRHELTLAAVCSVEGCTRQRWGRGFCATHYSTWWRDHKEPFDCEWCGHNGSWSGERYCSQSCHGAARANPVCDLPARHPVMLLLYPPTPKLKPKPEPKPKQHQLARECPGCACWFTPLSAPTAICCSTKCKRKMHRHRRRARESGALGSWRWSDFMRIAAKFDYCCAYCGVKPDRLDADHVVPLSRGGYDSPSNLLPTCNECNGHKSAMTLDEWATFRAERGLEPRATNWAFEDKRYHHLTQALLPLAG